MNRIRIEFLSEGECVKGWFYLAGGTEPAHTLLLIPGWPGNPNDVLGMGSLLSEQGINVCMFNPRGIYESEGIWTFPNTMSDIGAAWRWLHQADVQKQLNVDPDRLSLGGWSYGGGVAMAYAAQDDQVRRVISVAGTDHGALIRELLRNPELSKRFRQYLGSDIAPEGPVRGEVEANLQELAEHQEIYGLIENSSRLTDRSLLLIGGWEDTNISIENIMLPLYRALKRDGAADVTFLVYHNDHDFSTGRDRIATDIRQWILMREVTDSIRQ